MEAWLQRRPALWRWLSWRYRAQHDIGGIPDATETSKTRAVVVGYGPVGKTLTRILNDFGIQPGVIELNIETVKKLQSAG
jgi:CPA2 family monovalent cation:H+ antiporter-2